MKIIPAIDIMDGQVVRLYKGDPAQKTVYGSDPIQVAKQWEIEGADMLHLVDLDATLGRGSNLDIIKKITDSVSIPTEIAGGLRNERLILDTAKSSKRIVLGTFAFQNRNSLQKISKEIGQDKIVISVDHRDGEIVTHGWTRRTGKSLIDSMKDFLEMGFSEFLLTSVMRDGTLEGPDLKYLEQACKLQNAHVIASGGVSNIDDIKNIKTKNAFGVILGKALYENKITIPEAKKFA